METEILIVGGGLSGLALADKLNACGKDWLLVEAQDELGGRIRSPEVGAARFDLGPAWFWPGQPGMARLARQLKLEVFEQFSTGDIAYQGRDGHVQATTMPASMQGALRVTGGMGALIKGLAKRLPAQRIHTAQPVTALRQHRGQITAATSLGHIRAKRVVLALPPRVAVESITFDPELPTQALQAARALPTWMAGQAKVLAVYDHAHWRAAGFSGDAMSQKGPLVEIHDASPASGGPYALFGFVGFPPDIRALHAEEIVALAQAQLVTLFGPEMAHPLSIQMMDWAQIPHIATLLDQHSPTSHPAYGLPPVLQKLWGGTLMLGPTETARAFGGFLEGALEAANAVARQLEA